MGRLATYSPTYILPGSLPTMRWFWLDRFTEFVAGTRATAVKAVTLSEDYLHDHWESYPLMPNTLIAEGMAQAGGMLVSEVYRFGELVVLAKFSRCVFEAKCGRETRSPIGPISSKPKNWAHRSRSRPTSEIAGTPTRRFSSLDWRPTRRSAPPA